MQILLIWLILLFFVSYYFSGKDFFTPCTMLVVTFIFSILLGIYILKDTSYTISGKTVWVIGSTMTISVIIGIMMYNLFLKVKIDTCIQEVTPISDMFTWIALIFVIIIACFLYQQMKRIGGTTGSFTEIMTRFRNSNSYSTKEEAQYPFWLRQLTNLMSAVFYIVSFNLLRFYKVQKRGSSVLQIIVIILWFVARIFSGARFSMMTNLIAIIFMAHMLRIQQIGKYKTYSFKYIFRMVVIVLFFAWVFYAIKGLVGRVSDSSLIEYTSHYMGTGIINLDLYFKYPPTQSNIWGAETFYALINALRRLGVIEINAYLVHREFRSIGNISMGNIYTALRDYHYDFGMIGIYILHSVFTIFISVYYEILKKSRGNYPIILGSMMYYSVATYMFTQEFFCNIISFGFLIQLTLVYILYKLLLEKRIKIKVKNK